MSLLRYKEYFPKTYTWLYKYRVTIKEHFWSESYILQLNVYGQDIANVIIKKPFCKPISTQIQGFYLPLLIRNRSVIFKSANNTSKYY